MLKLSIGASLIGTILAASVVPAASAEVPAQYRGLWCSAPDTNGTRYYRCRSATDEAYLDIRRNRINLTEESDCYVNVVVSIAKGHRLHVYCPNVGDPDLVDLRLDTRGRLPATDGDHDAYLALIHWGVAAHYKRSDARRRS